MKPSWRKVEHEPTSRPKYRGVHIDDTTRAVVWTCHHRHWSKREALRCAVANLGAPGPQPGPPPGLRSRLPVVRRSWVESLLSCSAWADDESSMQAQFGTCVHEAIHVYWRLCKAAGEESLLHRVDDVARAAFYRVPRGLPPARVDDVVTVLDYFAHCHTADLHTLWALEHTFVLPVAWAVLTGTCDRIDRLDDDDAFDPPRILQGTDYKSHWRRSSDHTFQGRFYGALAMQLIPTLEEWWWLPDHVRSNYLPEPTRWPRSYLEAWWAEVEPQAARAWAGRGGAPTGGSACEYCRLRASCAGSIAPYRLVPTSDEQARTLAGEWIRAKAMEAELQAALKAYLGEVGTVEHDGLLVGYPVTASQGWDVAWPEDLPVDPVAHAEWLTAQVQAANLHPVNTVSVKLDKQRVGRRQRLALQTMGITKDVPARVQFRATKLVRDAQEEQEGEPGGES